MRIRKRLAVIASAAAISALLLPSGLSAQEISSSINAYSPYTMYGLGDLSLQGTSAIRSMGGAGVAYRSPYMTNYLNPASVGAIGQRSFLLNFGMEGQDFYLKSRDQRTLYNTFNIRDIGIAFPIMKNLGVIFSVTPFSSIGYKVEAKETDPDIIADLGSVKYTYLGAGDITQIKLGLGSKIAPRLFVGAEVIFLKGALDRYFTTSIKQITAGGDVTNVTGNDNTRISRAYVNLGVIYNILSSDNKDLTIGATYRLGGKLNADITRDIPSGNYIPETAVSHNYVSELAMPSEYTLGLSYNTTKIGINADYTFRDWGSRNASLSTDMISYRNTNSFKAGLLYIPKSGDVRNYMNRMSYRIGVRVEDYYMRMQGHEMLDKALTLGLGFPIKAGLTNVNFGFEVGQRGTTKHNLIRENYFRFSLEFSLFGEDDWFRKFKIN